MNKTKATQRPGNVQAGMDSGIEGCTLRTCLRSNKIGEGPDLIGSTQHTQHSHTQLAHEREQQVTRKHTETKTTDSNQKRGINISKN